ncbi:MAG: hypothetical protein R6V40_02015 [Candidatus Moraniibacteriota bacterium]
MLKESFKNFFRNKFAITAIAASFLLNIAGILLLKFNIDFNKALIILHYNSYLGIDRVVYDSENVWLQVYAVSFSALAVSFLNIFLAFFLYHAAFRFSNKKNKEKDLRQNPRFLAAVILLGASLALQIIVLLYTISIVLVNG